MSSVGEGQEEVISRRHACQTPNCGKSASLLCPTCVKLELGAGLASFCSQSCFKGHWAQHKQLHTQKKLLDAAGRLNLDCLPTNPWPNFEFTGQLRPYRQSPPRPVPDAIPRPDYALHPQGISLEERQAKGSSVVKVLDEEEREGLRVACRLGREVLDAAAAAVDVGVTTDELDRVVHEACVERDCYPSPLGYYNFPKSCCTSVNEVVCHGIPDLRPLADGDIVNVDVTVFHRGFHGDLNETFLVGRSVDEDSLRLVRTTNRCLEQAIAICRPGVKFREIGQAIQKEANANGCSVVRTYCGHGIHRLFHTVPNVPHYAKNRAVGVMKAGNSFTIEPMINLGAAADCQWPDEWTAVTRDGKRSAQFEQTCLITEEGCDVLTARSGGRRWFEDQLDKWDYKN